MIPGGRSESDDPAQAGDADLRSRIRSAKVRAEIAHVEAESAEAAARATRRRADSLKKHYDDLLLELQGQLTIDINTDIDTRPAPPGPAGPGSASAPPSAGYGSAL